MTEQTQSIGAEPTGSEPPPPPAASPVVQATEATRAERDKPWVMRTYAGHSSPKESNALYRRNLSKGQTGLSVAFDLPTQTGYDPDDELARGEVGKVGVPVTHVGDMRALFDEHPARDHEHLDDHQRHGHVAAGPLRGRRRGAGSRPRQALGHHAERHHQGVPVAGDLRLPARAVAAADHRHGGAHGHRGPEVEPDQHLQLPPAGGRRDAGAGDQLRAVHRHRRARRREGAGQVPDERFGDVCARISFFVNAGVRFVEEMCKMRAFTQLWDELLLERYGVQDPKHRRFRYGVQVNSLGLTEAQPENNVQRIVLEMLGVSLSKKARARAIQLPAWNEALGLPRPVGPAVVAAPAAGARVRDRPARARRPVRGLGRRRAQGVRADL
jgi:(2R)-ethylmalonyl-CoA mutase